MRSRRRRPALFLALVTAWVAFASPAWAQSSQDRPRWEIEGFGGLMISNGPADGTSSLPPPGAPIATTSPIFPSRRVPSWFLGDGAELLNLVNQQFDVPALIRPLDAALDGSALDAGAGLAGGVRVRRALGARHALEFSLELFPDPVDLSDELLAAVDASRDSFVPAFEGLLATGPFTDVDVRAASEVGGSSLELAATGAFVYRFGVVRAGALVPYVTLGGGLVTGVGDGPTAMLEGGYRFLILDEVPIDETDRVTIRHERGTGLAGLLGAGLRRDVSARWGVRVDGRVLVGPRTSALLVDTDPTVARGTPPGFVESFTTPSIQFSNDPATGRESTLGPPPLEAFEAFESDGLRTRVRITAGVFVRF